jgi:hypothetical protein
VKLHADKGYDFPHCRTYLHRRALNGYPCWCWSGASVAAASRATVVAAWQLAELLAVRGEISVASS